MKLLVLGAGALGSAIGGFMARAGHETHLVGRNPHMDMVTHRGLRIDGIWGRHQVNDLHAHTDLRAIQDLEFDLILIAVKSYHTQHVMRLVQPLLHEDVLVCSYQNGLGNAETIAEVVGWEKTVGARVIYGARINEPGEVEITVIAAPTTIGEYHKDAPVSKIKTIAHAMDASGVPTVYTDTIQTVLWSKVAYNSALNPLSALLDVPYGTLAKCEHTRHIMDRAIHELYRVAEAMKVPLAPVRAEEYLTLFYDTLLPPTAAHYASMREDLKKGRPTEIDAMNGAIARFGAQHGVDCPVNTTLAQLIHARERLAP